MEDMIKDIKKRWRHYLVLLVIINMGVGLFAFLDFNRTLQYLVLLATSIGYLAWGVIHHWVEEDLHIKVFLEYFLIVIAANLFIFSLLWRA